jgi:transcriptional regulator with XRE-family HTH domain
MSPKKQLRESSDQVTAAVDRLWVLFGQQVRDARQGRGWSVAELAHRAGISASFLYLIESGRSGSAEGAARVAHALGRRADLTLVDSRRQQPRNLDVDLVHSAMGECEARRFRQLGIATGLDQPYQHYQFAGRADFVAWDPERRALLHIENRTRFPDFQSMAGAFNGKRAYLAAAIGERLGIRRWNSETHVIAALWSAESLHALRLRADSFRSLCPDPSLAFDSWWRGEPPGEGNFSTLVVFDPFVAGRQRAFAGLDDALIARARYKNYADAAERSSNQIRRR